MAKVHRMYRHTCTRKAPRCLKEPTHRDWQAICNFLDEGISYDTLAEHFVCKSALIEEEIVETDDYGYRARSDIKRSKGNVDLGCSPKGLT